MCRAHLWYLVSVLQGISWAHLCICNQLAHWLGIGWSYLASCTCLADDWGCWLGCLGSLPHGFSSLRWLTQASFYSSLRATRGGEKLQGLLRSRLWTCIMSYLTHFYKVKASGKVIISLMLGGGGTVSLDERNNKITLYENAHGGNDSLRPHIASGI